MKSLPNSKKWVLVAGILALAPSVRAASITYYITPFSTADFSVVGGMVVTDGTLGALDLPNYLSAQVTVTDGVSTRVLLNWATFGTLIATADELMTTVPGPDDSSGLDFSEGTNEFRVSWKSETYSFLPPPLDKSASRRIKFSGVEQSESLSTSEPILIASTTVPIPEPAGLLMVLAGLLPGIWCRRVRC